MSRDLTSGMIAELDAEKLRPLIFYEGEFSGGTVRLWSGVSSTIWNAQTWTGAGNLLSISDIAETTDLRAQGNTVSLSGLPTALISTALSQALLGLPGIVWLGCMNASGAVIADPSMAFKGKLDVPSIEDNGDTCTISISYENQLIYLEISNVRRWTHDDQQIDHPGDPSFQYMASSQDQPVIW